MFLDPNAVWPPPEPRSPPPPRPRMSKRRERLMGWIVGFNLLMLLVGPLAGVSVLDMIVALARR